MGRKTYKAQYKMGKNRQGTSDFSKVDVQFRKQQILHIHLSYLFRMDL